MTPDRIAASFRTARLSAQPLDAYPSSEVPPTLESAYAIQQTAIAAWPDRLVGWKVAAIRESWRARYPADRLSGPIFAKQLSTGDGERAIIRGGYAAVEAEFALLLAPDFPLNTPFTSVDALLPYVSSVHAAIELAGSPLPNLSDLGPGAVISDFGNNIGLVIGPELEQFFDRPLADWNVGVKVGDALVGEGSPERIPGGPLASVLFLANSLVSRGSTLRPGDWVSTGASTGAHPVRIGDQVEVSFDGKRAISLRICEAQG